MNGTDTVQPAARPGRLGAWTAILVGAGLLLSGLIAALGYLGLPLLGDDVLAAQLGQTAAMFLGLICGPLALIHGINALRGRPSKPMRLPWWPIFWIVFALAVAVGNVLLEFDLAVGYLFPPLFFLAAAFPTLGVLAWSSRRLGWPATWRQSAMALVIGSTLSVGLAIVLEATLSILAFELVTPLDWLSSAASEVADSGGLPEPLAMAPFLIPLLIGVALAAPIPEEFAKALALPLLGRRRVSEERQAFLLGLAAGAGFAILENMLYEGVYAQWEGWSWGGIALLRGIGSVMHPLCTGLVALGWVRVRERGSGALLGAFLAAVLIHTLWNGGFDALLLVSGLGYYGDLGPTISLYGEATEIVLVIYLALLSAGLWWVLRKVVIGLAGQEVPEVAPARLSSRGLAAWAVGCALLLVPIGALLGPAWSQIRAVVLPGL